VVKSDIHSTDTGGYSEVLFGAMHLLGFAFAPRIKNFGKCQLYAFNKRKEYQLKGYNILPDGYIKTQIIDPQWDEILRFIATIKLKEATLVSIRKLLNPSHNCSNASIPTPVNIRSITLSRSLARFPSRTFFGFDTQATQPKSLHRHS
jgi:TnpA family transposase